MLIGNITEEELEKIKDYTMNPVDSRIASDDKPQTLVETYDDPEDVKIFDGFKDMTEADLKALYQSLGLAMTFNDFKWIQQYFHDDEKRDPSMTEIRVLDTYWSDHCRHTTFGTELKDISFEDGFFAEPIKASYEDYLASRDALYTTDDKKKEKFISLMDIALMGMKKLKKDGKLTDMEESEENNACTVVVPVEVDYGNGPSLENWLVFFKNETHNHPTEIEPFGGAATCLGGAIRDPLSGRGYVYQAMRVTGAADPTVPVAETMKGKLSQKKLVRGAASGYSSYGNQIGLATGYVKEVYHPGYVAKRMEIGAVMGAAPQEHVIRESADPGDIIILLGGRTGRDGCGGATGSSKAHDSKSLTTCGAEVQKGNAPTERKLQRLFRRPEVSELRVEFYSSINGVAAIHTDILKDSELNDFYKIYPEKFNNKTNGITFRRWLLSCNHPLADFLSQTIGDGFKKDANKLEKLLDHINDEEVLDQLEAIKMGKKKELVDYLKKHENVEVDPDSIFDIQVKRLHEYKRQQMNALYIIHKYLEIKGGKKPSRPLTFIFGAKAAPAYVIAKDIIHLLLVLQEIVNNDPDVNKYMKVIMVENYNVSYAEKLIPACDVSEQISLASKEASGTSNMKFMLNGAVTLGTDDGANVEIHELVGDDNIYIFGVKADEVIEHYKKADYVSKDYYKKSKVIKEAVDFIVSKECLKVGHKENLERLYNELLNKDWFMTLIDLESYIAKKDEIFADYEKRDKWKKMMLTNIAKAGYFSSDRTIAEYNRDIWHLN